MTWFLTEIFTQCPGWLCYNYTLLFVALEHFLAEMFIHSFIYLFIHTYSFFSVLREGGCQFRPCFPRGLNKWWKTFCSFMRSWCQILSPPFFPIRDRAPFVLTSDMAYVINGGERPTSRFQLFVDLCCQAYNLIRKNSGLFLNLLSLVREKTKKTNKPEYIHTYTHVHST